MAVPYFARTAKTIKGILFIDERFSDAFATLAAGEAVARYKEPPLLNASKKLRFFDFQSVSNA